jgi:serine/threonine protein kinase
LKAVPPLAGGSPISLAVGAHLGPYEIQALIGAGGMGEVYRAGDTRLDRSVAIKVLPPDVRADPERFVRFDKLTIGGLWATSYDACLSWTIR